MRFCQMSMMASMKPCLAPPFKSRLRLPLSFGRDERSTGQFFSGVRSAAVLKRANGVSGPAFSLVGDVPRPFAGSPLYAFFARFVFWVFILFSV